jgi:hypothetical protein
VADANIDSSLLAHALSGSGAGAGAGAGGTCDRGGGSGSSVSTVEPPPPRPKNVASEKRLGLPPPLLPVDDGGFDFVGGREDACGVAASLE